MIGLNEAILTDDTTGDTVGSAFVQVSTYSTIITADMATAAPEPPAWLLLVGGLAGFFLLRLRAMACGRPPGIGPSKRA